MKKILSLLFVLGLALSACGTSPTQSAPPAQTSTPTLSPTATQTPIPPTATVTPLPTIPTFTPTFDVSTIVTVTPAEKAECPKENLDALAMNILPEGDNPYDEKFIGRIIEFLNNGGQVSLLNLELNKTNTYIGSYGSVSLTDITNDRVPELLIKLFGTYLVLKCDNGKYVLIYSLERVFVGAQTKIDDLNQNSIPELIVSIDPCADRFCPENWILEWDGDNLETLLHVTGKIKSIADTDGTGIREIIVAKYPNFREFEITDRVITSIYTWNGTSFSQKTYKGEENFRFQLIQDADRELLYGNLDIALEYYQEAIVSNKLEWWSKERRDYEVRLFYDSYNLLTPTSLPYPEEDITEYPRLAAYAYYRIMLLHLAQGGEAEAASTYQTLQETFGNDPYAAPYVEMASAFWEAYQSTRRMYDGCAAAIQYALEHPEILVPLGSDYHGWQSHIYEPADVCPFR